MFQSVKDEILLSDFLKSVAFAESFQTVKDEILRKDFFTFRTEIIHFKPLRMRFCFSLTYFTQKES